MKRYGARQADIIINASDRETLHLLDGYDVVLEPQRFGGTSLALLPDRLLGALPEYIEQMLGPGRLTWKVENQDITFTCQGQTQIFPAHRLTQLCFGVVAPDADPMTPIPEHSPLREALETVFPVQLPHYGYNFV
jgi:hypothetical protein